MNSKNNRHEQLWCDAVRECGCIITGNTQVQLHHIWGSKFKHNKIHIGNYAVLALSPELHDVSSNHVHNVTHNKNAFHFEFGSNAELFQKTIILVAENFNAGVQPPQKVIESILDWGEFH